MNEEKVKRGKGRPKGSLSHIEISTNELAKYCFNNPNDTIMVSRVFWEKKIGELPVKPQVDIGAGAGVEWVTPEFARDSLLLPTQLPSAHELATVKMTLSE